MSMKSSNDTIWNQTHDLTACSTMPQPMVPMRARFEKYTLHLISTPKDLEELTS
jgi:hypothetical protein